MSHDRNVDHWKKTTYQMHIDAARTVLGQGGHGMDAVTHALIALAMIQAKAIEEGRWGG